MSWTEYTLSDVTTFIKRGSAPKYVENDGIIILNQKCIRDNTINVEYAKLTTSDKKIQEERFLQEGDIVVNSTGTGTLGRTAFVKSILEPTTVDTHVTIVRPDQSIIYPRFLGYQMSMNERYIEAMGKGSTNQIELSTNDLSELEIVIPSLPTQRRIASILSAYDDLIENNMKRIKLLEEAAQNIYREWFVEMRFPGHENVEWYTDENGRRLPVGWNLSLIQDFCNVSGGGTPSTKEPKYWEGGEILWFSPTDLSKNSSIVLTDSAKKITTEGLKNSSAKLLPERTILMSSRATIGLFGIISQPCTTNQGFINILPHNEWDRYYLLFNLMSRKVEIESYASGTTFKEISKQNFKKLDILVPHNCQLKEFHRHILPIIDMIERIEHTNNTLKEARDILLPRLMNQTIEV